MKKSRQDWIEAGLNLLRDEGQQALTIERLTLLMGLTKGSFYHHFKGLPGYQEALLQTWEKQLTLDPVEIANQESEPKKRSRLLGATVRKLDHRLDLAVRAWGMRDREVQDCVARVDQIRLQCLAKIQAAQGRPNPQELAELEYACFIGSQQLGLKPSLQKLFGRAIELLAKGELP